MASYWLPEHPKRRPEHGGQFQNPWQQQPRKRGDGQFQNPWDRRGGAQFQNPWVQRGDGRDDHEDGDRNYKNELISGMFGGSNTDDTVDIKLPVVSWEDLQYPSGELGAIPKRPEVIDDEKQMEYLTKILGSKVYDVATESPFHLAPNISDGLGVNLWLKREDSQGFSFKIRGSYNMMSHLSLEEGGKRFPFRTGGDVCQNKMANHPEEGYYFMIRGAYNMMAKLPKEELKKGVICVSTGDQAQGLALAANKLGTEAIIVMPTTTPPIKVEKVENLGGKVVLHGDTFDDAQAHATEISQEQNMVVIPPFDDEDVISGQGTVGMEISRQMRDPLQAIFVPVGGGGLVAGIASFYKYIYPEVKIIGVEARDANPMALALHRNEIVKLGEVGSLGDGMEVKQVGKECFRIAKELVDGVVLVNKDDICTAIKDMYEETGSMLEPSGVLAIAGAKAYCKYNNIKGVNMVAVTTGSKMNFNQLGSIVDIVDAANQTEATFASLLPEKPGSLGQFYHLIQPCNITELKYRYNDVDNEAVVFYSVGVNVASELEDAKRRIESSPFETYDLTKNETVKDHLRYMVGGRSKVPNEVFYRFILPERPGALGNLLDAISPRWNISLIHYRRRGMSRGDVLVGVQIEEAEMGGIHERAKQLGFSHNTVADDPASKLLLMNF